MPKIVYKFYKSDCAPCYALSRLLLNIKIPQEIEIVQKNVSMEENKIFAKEHGINTVPALMFEDGRILKGLITRDNLISFLTVD